MSKVRNLPEAVTIADTDMMYIVDSSVGSNGGKKVQISTLQDKFSGAITTDDPVTLNPDQANAEGVSTSLAKADHIHNVPTAVAVSTSTSNTEGVSTSFARADHTHNTIVSNYIASSAIIDTSNVTTDTLIPGMTLTPPAGTYLVKFESTMRNSANGTSRYFVNIYVNGVIVSNSDRDFGTGGGSNAQSDTSTIVTVNGSEAIEARCRVVAGTNTYNARSLILIRLG